MKPGKIYRFNESDLVPLDKSPWIYCGYDGWTCKCGSFEMYEDHLPWEWFKKHKKCVEKQ